MSLNEPNQLDIIRKQLRFKFNSNASSFTIFVAIQFFALLFSFSAESSTSYFDEESYISMLTVSSSIHIVFMMIWAFAIGASLAKRWNWDEAFSFVTTRFTHHLSNLLYMFIFALFAGLTASLIGPALRLLAHLRFGEISVLTPTITEAPSHFFYQFVTAAAYIFLLFIVGYTLSSCTLIGKAYSGIVALLIFGIIFSINFVLGFEIVGPVIFFFSAESFLPFFLIKIIGVCAALFAIAVLVTNRLEVRNS